MVSDDPSRDRMLLPDIPPPPPDGFVWPDLPPFPDGFTWPDMPPFPDGFTWPDGGFWPDGGTVCPTHPGVIGKACYSSASCGAGHFCLMVYGTSGVCTRTCIADDPYTPLVNEDNCPVGNQCGTLSSTGSSGQNLCFRKCTPKLGCGDCDPGIACHPQSGSYVDLEKQGVCLFQGCKSNNECPVTTGIGCSTLQQNCPAGQFCVQLTQISSSGTQNGVCAKPGKCDILSGLCDVHNLGKPTAKVGDPCKGDTDCGNAMTCLYEVDESKLLKKGGDTCQQNNECCSGTCLWGTCTQGLCEVRYRNGYCTILGCSFKSTLPAFSCPTGSTCVHIYGGGLCQKSCDLTQANTCRNNPTDLWGDYECRDWSNLAWPAGQPGAGGPACDFGFAVPCTTWWQSKLDCSVLGNQNNSTNMSCRDYQGTVLSNKYSPDGRCFDDTASGTTKR